MQILKPNTVKLKFGPLFSRGFHTLVDEKIGMVRIVEECSAKGPVEWDAVNRKRAGGVLTNVIVDGTTLIMDATIGCGKVRFGPASRTSGGQVLKSIHIHGKEVYTKWAGLAGASVGIGACLPQSPGVTKTIYPSGRIILGGSNSIEVTIVSPKKTRLLIGIDDTDTKDVGATWVLGLKMAGALRDADLLQHRIIQLNPNIKEKTTNCVSTAIELAVEDDKVDSIISSALRYIKRHTFSDNTAVAVHTGLVMPKRLRYYGFYAKRKRIDIEATEKIAKSCGVRLIEVTGQRGKIGALAAIGCFDMGLHSASLPTDSY